MKAHPTDMPGVYTLQTTRHGDARGSFARWFCEETLAPVLHGQQVCQINHSHTRLRGTVRGMHFQHAPHAETKIVRCVYGEILDVVVDLRQGSPTFLQWRGFVLGENADDAVLIPPGCAHGFQALTDDVHLIYLHTHAYTPSAEGGVHAEDPRIGIAWPLPITHVSERDRAHPCLPDHYQGVTV